MPDFKIDLHVHYKSHARDAEGFERDMLEAAKAAGLDAITFTEHGQQLSEPRLDELRAEFPPMRIYRGVEIACGFDVLVYDRPDILADRAWTYRELWSEVMGNGGIMALAHPRRRNRPLPKDVIDLPPHAMEVASRNTPPWAIVWLMDACCRLGCSPLVNSDAHKPRHLSAHYNAWLLSCDALPLTVAGLIGQRLENYPYPNTPGVWREER